MFFWTTSTGSTTELETLKETLHSYPIIGFHRFMG
jgi:hypothetical protein